MNDLLQKTKIPAQQQGSWIIKKFKIKKERAEFFNMQQMFNGMLGRAIAPGSYTKLGNIESQVLMMSDTPAELRDHREAVYRAHDHCLIAGLGLGIIAEACLRKKDVTHVTILEKEPDIIKMVKPYLEKKWSKKRFTIIECDALKWQPPKDIKYGMAWFDIWPEMDSDNLPDMHLLHRRYGRKATWKGSWGRDVIERDLRSNRSYW